MHGPSPLLLQLRDVIHGGIIVDLPEDHSRFHPSRGCPGNEQWGFVHLEMKKERRSSYTAENRFRSLLEGDVLKLE